eukprot:XP_001691113.1 predicted protein [Chlamydomonas reinhardtii]
MSTEDGGAGLQSVQPPEPQDGLAEENDELIGAPDGLASFTRPGPGPAARQQASAQGQREAVQQPVWGQARPKGSGHSLTRPPPPGTHNQPTTPAGSSLFFDGWGARRSRGAVLRPGSVAAMPSGHRVPVAAVSSGDAAALAVSFGAGGDMDSGTASALLPKGAPVAYGTEQGATRMVTPPSGPGRAYAHTHPAAVNLWAQTEVLTRPSSSSVATTSGGLGFGQALAAGAALGAAPEYRDPPAFPQLLRGGTATTLHYHMPTGATAAASSAGSVAFVASAASWHVTPLAKSSAMSLANPTAASGPRVAGWGSQRMLTPPSAHVQPDPATVSPHAGGAAASLAAVSPATARLLAMSPTLSVRCMEQPTNALANVMQVQPLSGSSVAPNAASVQMAGGLGNGGGGAPGGLLRDSAGVLVSEADDVPGPQPHDAPPPLPLMPHFAQPPPLVPLSAHAAGAAAALRGLSFGRGPIAGAGDATSTSPRSPPRSPTRPQMGAALSPEASAGPVSAQASFVDLAGQPIHMYTGQPSPRQHSQRTSPRRVEQPPEAPASAGPVKRPVPFSAAAAPVTASPRGLASTSTRALVLGLAGAGTSAKQLNLMMDLGAAEESEMADGADQVPPVFSRRPDPTAAPSPVATPSPHPPPQHQPSVAALGSASAIESVLAPASKPRLRPPPPPQHGKGKSPGQSLASISATGPGYSLRKSLFPDEVETKPLEERLGLAAAIAAVSAGSGSAAAAALRQGVPGQGDQPLGAATSGSQGHQPLILRKKFADRSEPVYYRAAMKKKLLGDMLRVL